MKKGCDDGFGTGQLIAEEGVGPASGVSEADTQVQLAPWPPRRLLQAFREAARDLPRPSGRPKRGSRVAAGDCGNRREEEADQRF